MAQSTIKTDGPELALQNSILNEIVSSGMDVRTAVSILANVTAAIIGMTRSQSDRVLRLFTETVVKRLEIERALRPETTEQARGEAAP